MFKLGIFSFFYSPLRIFLAASTPLIGTNREVATSSSCEISSKISRKCEQKISLNNFYVWEIFYKFVA